MSARVSRKVTATVAVLLTLGLGVIGQDRMATEPARQTSETRDNFGPQQGRGTRLSRAALAKAVQEEAEEEERREEAERAAKPGREKPRTGTAPAAGSRDNFGPQGG